jgi:hypothetical protein
MEVPMKAIKFAASALAVLALAVSSGCQMFHSPEAPAQQVAVEPVQPANNISIDLDIISVKLNDPKAADVDWTRLKQDILGLVPNANVLMFGDFKAEHMQSQEAHLSHEVTPDVLRKALALQGKVSKENLNHAATVVVNGKDSSFGYAEEIGFLKLPLCHPNRLAPGVFRKKKDFVVTPLIRSTGDILLTYSFAYTPEIEVPGCPDDVTRSILPGGLGIKRVAASTLPKGQTMVVSGFREQGMDPVTQTYKDSPDNEVQIVVLKPTIMN